MNDEVPLPRFRKPPVSEVVLGVQFPSVLGPAHLGLYYEKVKSRFPKFQVHQPVASVIETFGAGALPSLQFNVSAAMQPRMWFLSEDDNFLIQLQSDRLLVNWRSGPQRASYPHFEAVRAVFTNALDELEALAQAEKMSIAVNQCEVVYVNPILAANIDVPLSEPQEFSVFAVPSSVPNGKCHGNTSRITRNICSMTKRAPHMAGSRLRWRLGLLLTSRRASSLS
jgi:uncharacterized protein (TIGR04255 family)